MNWKVLALIPVLTLATAVPAFSKTTNKTQNAASTTPVAQSSQPSNTMKKPTAIKKPSAGVTQTTTLQLGSKGEGVKVAQNFLKQQGLYNGNVNGVFDNQTRSAVIKFQKSKGLRGDGIVGRRTLAAMK